MFRFSPNDYRPLGAIWQGTHPEGGPELRVEDTIPEDFEPLELAAEPQLNAPASARSA